MENLFNWLYNLMYQNDALALAASFGWGVLSVMLSPCHLATLPLLLAYIANQTYGKGSGGPFKLSLLFSLGILATIFIIGIITSSLGGLMGDIGSWGNVVTGLLLIFAGLFFLDLLNINGIHLNTGSLKIKGGRLAFVLGLTAGLALGPCTFAFMAPVFAYGLQLAESKPFISFSLFLFYGIGHCLVILLAGLLSAKIQNYLNWAGSSKGIMIFKKTCGALVIAGGVYIIYLGFMQ